MSKSSHIQEDRNGFGSDAGVPEVPPDRASSSDFSLERAVTRLRLLWKHRRLLFRTALVGLFLSTVLAFLIPVRYEATTQLMPPDNQFGTGMALLSSITGRTSGLGAVAGDLLGAKNSGALFVGVLQSRTVRDRVIDQFGLKQVYGESKMEDARQALADHTSISEDRKSGILSITVTDHDPKRAAAIAQAYVAELDRLVAEVSTSSARRERIFLEERLATVKRDLNEAAKKFSEFASKNTAIDIPAQGKAMVEAAANLQGQLIAAESELRGLEAIYTDQNIRVRALRARVAELRTQLGKIAGDSKSAVALSAKNDLSLYPSIRQLPLLGVTYADLFRQTKIEETVFELLTQQYELAKVQEAKEIPSVRVLDAAVIPSKKSFPHRSVVISAGTLIAISAICTYLFAKHYWGSIDSQGIGKQFAQEVVGTIRLETAHFVPAGGLLNRVLTRFRKRSKASPVFGEDLPVQKDRPLPNDLTRAARGGSD